MNDTHISNRHTAIRVLNVLLSVGVILFLVGLPFQLVIKRLIPDPLGTYWKEGLLGLLVLLWAVQCLLRRRILLTGTPLDSAVLAYLGLLLLRFALDGADWVASWGLYVSVLYLPLFWLVPTALRDSALIHLLGSHEEPRNHRPVRWLLALLVGVGAIVALGGLAEFLLDVSLWPSDEITQRLGHPDFYIYGSHIRRVYFTFDSPTALANTLAMLLPLGLVLTFAPSPAPSHARGHRWSWLQVVSGASSLLMAACIVVTFSRGIWVAAILSLLAMVVLGGLARNLFTKKRLAISLITAGVIILFGLVWAIVLKFRTITASRPTVDVIELSSEAYAAVPVVEIQQTLIKDVPLYGQSITQTWSLLDPIAGVQDTKTVLYEHPSEQGKAEIIYRIQVPPATDLLPALRFSIALSPSVWSPEKGDGTSFQIYVTDAENAGKPYPDNEGQFAFVRYLNPKHNPSDRRWRNFVLDLSLWSGRAINVTLITEAGPAGNWAYDWGGWAQLEVVTIEPELFRGHLDAQQENAITRHIRSILDWARDETNRDRLAAWNLSLAAWRASPLWGQGLGTTGVAALRTHPERAFVTESQVLKSLVELGLPGLLTLAYLWFQIARTGSRAYRSADSHVRGLLWGILASLMIAFVEGWVYQNLEVKQVNAYFWTLVGLLGSLAPRSETND